MRAQAQWPRCTCSPHTSLHMLTSFIAAHANFRLSGLAAHANLIYIHIDAGGYCRRWLSGLAAHAHLIYIHIDAGGYCGRWLSGISLHMLTSFPPPRCLTYVYILIYIHTYIHTYRRRGYCGRRLSGLAAHAHLIPPPRHLQVPLHPGFYYSVFLLY